MAVGVGSQAFVSPAPDCPLCGHPMRPWLHVPTEWRGPSFRDCYHLFWCKPSGFGQLYPRPTPHEISRFYLDESYFTHRGGDAPRPRPCAQPFPERIRIHLAWRLDQGTRASAEVLDALLGGRKSRVCAVGCGAGGRLLQLKERGHTTVGVEPDPVARGLAREKGLTVYEGTAEDLPDCLERGAFDLVLLMHVLEHCLDPMLALRNARALLNRGGALVCAVPNNESTGLEHRGAAWAMLDVPRHLNFFTARSLSASCEAAGMQVVTTMYRGYTRQFSALWVRYEQRLWDLQARGRPDGAPRARRNSTSRSWLLLARNMNLKIMKADWYH